MTAPLTGVFPMLARYAALTLGLDWTGETAAADAAGHLG
jgi:hypothetical protein